MSWLDGLFLKYRRVASGGYEFPPRARTVYVNCTVTDDPANDQTIVTGLGNSLFATTTGPFTQPAAAANVSVSLTTTAWMVVGQYVFIEGAGFYTVTSIADVYNVTLNNTYDSVNAAPGTVVGTGAGVATSGPPGLISAPIITSSGGGNGLSGGTRPDLVTERDNVQTTDATLTTFKTYAVPVDKKQYDLVVKLSATRTDVAGDANAFMRRIIVLRNGAGLTTMRADGPLDGPWPVGTSSTWAVTLVPSGDNILLKVQGAVGKTIKWSLIKESFEET